MAGDRSRRETLNPPRHLVYKCLQMSTLQIAGATVTVHNLCRVYFKLVEQETMARLGQSSLNYSGNTATVI